jgi:long-subunit fatty acid transport protein
MFLRRRAREWGACLCVLLGASAAHADPFHHQPVPIGERALGMGGAFTGVANEPSAAYYNPAGLVRLEDTTLSAGLTLTAFDRLTLDDGYRTSVGRADLKHAAKPSLPLFVSLVKQIGKRDAQRRRHHAVALSTFTTDQRRLDYDAKLERFDNDGRTVVDTFYVSQENTSRWNGLSYAYRLNSEFSFGLSAFVSFSQMRHVEERLNVSFFSPDATQTGSEPRSRLDSRRTSADVTSGVVRLGALYAVPHYRLGLMLQPPGLHVKGSARLRDREVVTDATGAASEGTFFETSDSTSARDPIPWEVRLGGAWEPTADFTLSCDVSVVGANGSADDPVVAIGKRDVDFDTGRAARPGDLALEEWYRLTIANVSVGMEYIIYDALVLRAGVFSDLSAAPDLPRTSGYYRPADVNRVGAALSFGIVTAGYDVSLGAIGKFGYGNAMAFSVGPSGESSYARTSQEEHTLHVFLTGARRAIGRLASVTVEKLNEPSPPPAPDPATVPLEPPALEPPAPAPKRRR